MEVLYNTLLVAYDKEDEKTFIDLINEINDEKLLFMIFLEICRPEIWNKNCCRAVVNKLNLSETQLRLCLLFKSSYMEEICLLKNKNYDRKLKYDYRRMLEKNERTSELLKELDAECKLQFHGRIDDFNMIERWLNKIEEMEKHIDKRVVHYEVDI